MDLDDLSCAICQEPFDADQRIPRMLGCGHTYCEVCLSLLFQRPPLVCPEDRFPITVSSVSELAKNFALIRVIQRAKESVQAVDTSAKCLDHKKKLEYVCLDDRVKVCANCALFGRHKGHNVRSEEEVMREVTITAECLFEMMQMMENAQESVLDAEKKNQLEDLHSQYLNQRSSLELQLQQSFSSARSKLSDMEKSAQQTLQRHFDYIETSFQSLLELPRAVDSRINAWVQDAKDRLDRISAVGDDSSAVAFDALDENTEVFSTGESVLMELETLKDLPISQLEEFIDSISLECSDALLSGLVRVRVAQKKQPEPQNTEVSGSRNPEVSAPKEEHPRKPVTKKPVNEKVFEEAMDALRLHTSETADFSGAGGTFSIDLSDRASQIPPLLISNFRLKSLKFVKNSVSDAHVTQICEVLRENTTLQSLHILQNPLSPEAMDAVIEMLGVNTTLKEVNLMGSTKASHEYRHKLGALTNKFRKVYT